MCASTSFSSPHIHSNEINNVMTTHALTDNLVQKFRLVTVFRDYTPNFDKRINALSFSTNGINAISSTNNGTIDVFDCNKGIQTSTIFLRKYGCGVVDFTDIEDTIVVASTKQNHAIRSLNIETKKYLTYFVGHNEMVNSLCVHRANNVFLSASNDKSIRLWDVRSPRSQSMTSFNEPPLVAWEPSGTLFAVGLDSKFIKLYDLRGMENGPLAGFTFNKENNCNWTNLKFSHNGEYILISTNSSKIRVIESFFGKIKNCFRSKFA